MNSVLAIILSFLFFLLPYKTCQSSNLQTEKVPFADGEDPSTPLFLTPLIEEKHITEARTRAMVRHHEMGNIESYSGYLTVNKKYNSNLFFWFFPALMMSNMEPVVLWLEHKPGLTSMFGVFEEHGPFSVTVDYTLEMRIYSMHMYHNVIYIDSPVGTGYSFTDNAKGYARNITQVANDLHNALVQFFLLFPELKSNDFFVTGEWYAGKYVAAVANAIKNHNIEAETKINLKGLVIGNGFCDPINQLIFSEYLWHIGLIDQNERADFQVEELQIRVFIREKNFVKAFENFNELFVSNLSLFRNLTGLMEYFNFARANMHYDDYLYNIRLIDAWMQKVDVRNAIHVGNNTTFNLYNSIVLEYQKEDFLKSVVDLLSDLVEHYRVLMYNGQVNVINVNSIAETYVQRMKWSGADKFEKASRKFWIVGYDIAGFTKSADKLTFVLVRNAGNLVFIDQPQWALDLITRFTHNSSFN